MTRESRPVKDRRKPREKIVELQNKLLKLWLDLRIEDPDAAAALKASADALEPIVSAPRN